MRALKVAARHECHGVDVGRRSPRRLRAPPAQPSAARQQHRAMNQGQASPLRPRSSRGSRHERACKQDGRLGISGQAEHIPVRGTGLPGFRHRLPLIAPQRARSMANSPPRDRPTPPAARQLSRPVRHSSVPCLRSRGLGDPARAEATRGNRHPASPVRFGFRVQPA